MSRYSCRFLHLCSIFGLVFSQCRTTVALHPWKGLKKTVAAASVLLGGGSTSSWPCLYHKMVSRYSGLSFHSSKGRWRELGFNPRPILALSSPGLARPRQTSPGPGLISSNLPPTSRFFHAKTGKREIQWATVGPLRSWSCRPATEPKNARIPKMRRNTTWPPKTKKPTKYKNPKIAIFVFYSFFFFSKMAPQKCNVNCSVRILGVNFLMWILGGEFLEGEFLRGLFLLENIGPKNSTPGSKIRIPEFGVEFGDANCKIPSAETCPWFFSYFRGPTWGGGFRIFGILGLWAR